MASRTKQKEEARARRLAEERERAEKARRDRRLRMVVGTVLVAIAVIAVAIAVSTSGGGSNATGLQKGKAASATTGSVNSLLTGIPQSGAVLGNPKAPVTLTYYGDLQCPICREFTLNGGLPQLIAKDVRSGKVKIAYKAFETATSNPSTFKTQQIAALAAGQQRHFWDYAELFYHEQGQEGSGYVTEAYLQGLAKQVPGLNLSQWESSRNNPALANQVVSDEQTGSTAGVSGTPTLVFTGPKGNAVAQQSVPSYAQLEQLVHKVS